MAQEAVTVADNAAVGRGIPAPRRSGDALQIRCHYCQDGFDWSALAGFLRASFLPQLLPLLPQLPLRENLPKQGDWISS